MTEILTTGLLGLYNRINLFASVQKEDVVDVTMFINNIPKGSSLAANRVMLASRTESLIYTGKDITPETFIHVLCSDMGRDVDKKKYESMREKYQPEFNTVTNKIGEGYKRLANTIMLTARADFHTKHGHDFMLDKYMELILGNGSIKEEL